MPPRLVSPGADGVAAVREADLRKLRYENEMLRREVRVAEELQQLRDENAMLRKQLSAYDVGATSSAAQARAVASRCRARASEAEALAAALEEGAVATPRPDQKLPLSVLKGAETAAAPLHSVRSQLHAPIRGSYLVERWKRGEGVPDRVDMPRRAFWTVSELERLAAMLSDAYDENGQPAWGLLGMGKRRLERGGGLEDMTGTPLVFTGEPLGLDLPATRARLSGHSCGIHAAAALPTGHSPPDEPPG